MAFFKFRNRDSQGSDSRAGMPPAAVPADSVEMMRRRARHRLLGAAVLVLVGVIGFPLLFDTQPRPVSVDIPIEIPDRARERPMAAPAARPAAVRAADVITEAADGSEISTADGHGPSRPQEHRADPAPAPQARPAAPAPVPRTPASSDSRPAREAPGGRAAANAAATAAAPAATSTSNTTEAGSRFIVQIGAYSDSAQAREVRMKLERAGLKTYTHVAKTAAGDLVRVRLGPFATRAEADKAASKVKSLSLSSVVLTL